MDQPNVVQPNAPRRQLRKRIFLWLGIVIVLVVGLFAYLLTGSEAVGFLNVPKIKCQLQGKAFEQSGWGSRCYAKTADAGKTCTQNSDCLGGACRPSAEYELYIPSGGTRQWNRTPQQNAEGYLLGTCDEKNYNDTGSSLVEPVTSPLGCTITQAFQVDSTDAGITCLFD